MRLGINIPNDIYERFKPLKNTHNLSKICREAIISRIEAYETAVAQANADGMEAIADKLFLEYTRKSIIDWQSIGRDDAKKWVILATLEDFENLFHNVSIRKKLGGELNASLWYLQIPDIKRFEDHQHEHQDWFDRQYDLDENTDPIMWAKSEYYNGWLLYVTAIWQMVKDRIATDAVSRTKSQAQVEQGSEIPDRLLDS